jgi:hypothetical protein
MTTSWLLRRSMHVGLVMGMFAWLGSVRAADPDPKVMSYQLPAQIKWTTSAGGNSQAVLYGDPKKEGLYIILVKWAPNSMSRPHFHPNDRLVTVISGTWWVGWGSKYDPASTFPMPAGSFVTHHAKQIHSDGAKDGEVVLQIVGQGPETSTPAEVK